MRNGVEDEALFDVIRGYPNDYGMRDIQRPGKVSQRGEILQGILAIPLELRLQHHCTSSNLLPEVQ
jgi:hypothetical protein